jgi:hypothetical protein
VAIRNSSDPAIGAIMQNLAGLFAPTSPQDLAAYAATAKAKQEAAAVAAKEGRLSDFFTLLKDPNADPEMVDRLGAGNEAWAPTQGFVARNMEDATKRYGYDQSLAGTKYSANASAGAARYGHELDYRGTTENNVRDNAGRIAVETIKPVGEGEISRGLDPGLAALFGMPAVAPLAGPAKPLSQDQYLAANVLPDMSPETLAAMAFGNTPVEQVVTPGGTGPVYSTRLDALGKPAYVKPDSGAKPTLGVAVYPDGRRAPIAAGNDGIWKTQDGNPIGPDAQVMDIPKAVGSASDIGVGATTATRTGAQNQLLAIKTARSTAKQLRDLIKSNPNSQGVVGFIRGTTQDMMATTGEVGRLFNDEVGAGGRIAQDIQNGLLDTGLASKYFDTSIPAIDMLTNLLAYQIARANDPNGRASDKDIENARRTIGGDKWLSNAAESDARLSKLDEQLSLQQDMLKDVDPEFAKGVNGGARSGPVTLTPGNEDADFEALPSGAQYLNPETGEIMEKP